jgi:hypothetical protein
MSSSRFVSSGESNRARAGTAIAALLLGICASSASPAENASGPFAGLDGAWSGAGTVSLADGTKERMRCKNQYLVREEGNNLQQALRCTSDSYQFHVNTYVDADNNGALSGNWTEMTRNVSGRVTGKVAGGKIEVSVGNAGAFSATMSIVTTGNLQVVKIRPKGTDVTLVSVTLSKAR